MKGHVPGEHTSEAARGKKLPASAFAIHTLHKAQVQAVDGGVEGSQGPEVAGLSTMLEQVEAILRNRANVNDLEVLHFSLHHLFSRIDVLYRGILPELFSVSALSVGEQLRLDDLLRQQHIWTKLCSIQSTLSRIEPLCHLLNDAIEGMLDVLDRTSESEAPQRQGSLEKEENEKDWLHALHSERLEEAMTAVMESLSAWQDRYNHLALFVDHFSSLVPEVPELILLDELFTILLDCTGAMFGDILPGFQAISAGDDEAVATLLFDLMHQSDQLLAQWPAALESLAALIDQYALKTNR